MRQFREFCADFEKKAEEAKMEKEALSPKFLRHAADVAQRKGLDAISKATNTAVKATRDGKGMHSAMGNIDRLGNTAQKRLDQSTKFLAEAQRRSKMSRPSHKPATSTANKKIDDDFMVGVFAVERKMRGTKV